MKVLRDRVAVVTGAGGGVGRALARNLAGRGCHLALVDIDAQALQDTASALAECGVTSSRHLVDVSNREQMAALPGAVAAIHGHINILVNNAGITLQKSFATHSIADWERMINLNLWGVIYGCINFLDDLRQADEAHIVNVSSMSAFVGFPTQSSYCATKAAVKGLSESLWAELASEGIAVTSVHPGAIKTEMIQATLKDSDNLVTAQRNYELAQRMGVTPEHAAERIVDAILKGKMRIRIGRDAVLLDLVKRLLPKAIHRPFVKMYRKQQGVKSL